MHFKSSWAHEFKDTQDEPFYLTPKNKVTVKMMTLVHNLQYYHDDDLKFAALELPYEVNIKKKFFLCQSHLKFASKKKRNKII